MRAKTYRDLSGLFADLPPVPSAGKPEGPELPARLHGGAVRHRMLSVVLAILVAIVAVHTLAFALNPWAWAFSPWLWIGLIAVIAVLVTRSRKRAPEPQDRRWLSAAYGCEGNPPLIGCRCMAWWRRGRRGLGQPAGRGPGRGVAQAGGFPPGLVSASTAPGRSLGAGLGVAARAPAGHAEPCGSAVTLEVPRPGRRCLWGAVSVDIPENAPGRREGRRGPPGAARRRAQPSPRHQGHLLTGSGHSARGAAARGAGTAARGAGAGRSGVAAQRGSAAIRLTGPAPGGRSTVAQPRPARSAFPGACLPRRLPFPG